MIAVITGSRYWKSKTIIEGALDYFEPSTIIHGGAKGADIIAAEFGKRAGMNVIEVPAEWDKHGKKAGMIRNRLMLDEYKPHMVLAFPMPNSIGTIGCINEAIKRQITIHIHYDTSL